MKIIAMFTFACALAQTPPRGIFAAMGYSNGMLNTESASVSTKMRNLKPLAIAPDRITKTATVYAVFAIE